jgi:hypothetical protein
MRYGVRRKYVLGARRVVVPPHGTRREYIPVGSAAAVLAADGPVGRYHHPLDRSSADPAVLAADDPVTHSDRSFGEVVMKPDLWGLL